VTTLVIHTPTWRARRDDAKDYERTLASGFGAGYALSRAEAEVCEPGCRVVVLCKDARKRSEGRLKRLVPTEKAGNGLQRYDVEFTGMCELPYRDERLRRTGVAVL
jgi:hypothetical protein